MKINLKYFIIILFLFSGSIFSQSITGYIFGDDENEIDIDLTTDETDEGTNA